MSSTSLPHATWQQAVRQVDTLLTIAIVMLLLTACMAAWAYRTPGHLALWLAQGAATLGVLLHLFLSMLLVRLLVWVFAARKRVQAGGKRTAQALQVRSTILHAGVVVLAVWLWTLGALGLPLSLPLMVTFPDAGWLLVVMIGVLLMQRIAIRHICRRLADALVAAEQTAQRTLVA
ncbi:hypothetical protein [Xanthomonas axonopodis]|uniref:Uncharacterized protein n=2 Tax=Xanthomonas axonopodis TaxID=53413 RepID=A0A098PT42_9XANT|nr:hypothetical protein [Xanthomonas axonopodis]KGE50279.1 hypothetical protein GW15_0222100 [Xanthomonas axonopodis pv. vasculorum]PPV05209.1 hypothetical protein XavaCFBP5823_20990 [Xanthomonas axonopodis pv. vasculorum]QKD86451.1 hypothetical protein XAV_08620 [Xanthomonas axonopodis pv. vasculorum]